MNNETANDFFVVMPARNEEKNIGSLLLSLLPITKNVIVVDDGSTDKTCETVKNIDNNILVLRHDINRGKGAALKTGCEAALNLGANVIVFMDADGQHLATDAKKIADKLVFENVDMVFGIRKFNKNMPILMKIGNHLLTFLVNKFSRIRIKDTQCGLRALTGKAFTKIKWRENNYSVETEMIINAGKHNLKYDSMEILTIYKDKYKGTNILDGIIILFNLFKWKMR